MRTMGAGEFRAKCLAILDEVNESGEPVIVTKLRDVPVNCQGRFTTTRLSG
jgi:PHD/YefM family antitoxin component YafN of YafNO toxin-antitoxin module